MIYAHNQGISQSSVADGAHQVDCKGDNARKRSTYPTLGVSQIGYRAVCVNNTFMGYGGMKYMKYNFDDEGWAAEVAKYNGELNYK